MSFVRFLARATKYALTWKNQWCMEWNKEFDLGQETLLRLPKRSEIFCHILPKQLSTNIQCMYSKTNQKKYSKILVAFVRMGESDDSVLLVDIFVSYTFVSYTRFSKKLMKWRRVSYKILQWHIVSYLQWYIVSYYFSSDVKCHTHEKCLTRKNL